MPIRPYLKHVFSSHRTCLLLLAFFWIAGLMLGIYAACHFYSPSYALMRADVFSGVSIVKLFAVSSLPVLITALAFLISPVLIFPIAFCKAAFFGFASICISNAFPGAGWLIRPLVMFSDLGAICVTIWLWTHCLTAQKKLSPGVFLVCILCIASICAVDQFLLMPFISKIAVQ